MKKILLIVLSFFLIGCSLLPSPKYEQYKSKQDLTVVYPEIESPNSTIVYKFQCEKVSEDSICYIASEHDKIVKRLKMDKMKNEQIIEILKQYNISVDDANRVIEEYNKREDVLIKIQYIAIGSIGLNIIVTTIIILILVL